MRLRRSLVLVVCTSLFMSVWVQARETRRLTDNLTEKPCIVVSAEGSHVAWSEAQEDAAPINRTYRIKVYQVENNQTLDVLHVPGIRSNQPMRFLLGDKGEIKGPNYKKSDINYRIIGDIAQVRLSGDGHYLVTCVEEQFNYTKRAPFFVIVDLRQNTFEVISVQVPEGLGAIAGEQITSKMNLVSWDLNPAATHLAYVLDAVNYRGSTVIYFDIQAKTSRRVLGYERAGYVAGTLTIDGPQDQSVLYGSRMGLGNETLVIAGKNSQHKEGLWMVSLPQAAAVWHEASFAAPGISGDHVFYSAQKPAVWLNPDGTPGTVFEQKAGLLNQASVPFWSGAGSAYLTDHGHTSILQLGEGDPVAVVQKAAMGVPRAWRFQLKSTSSSDSYRLASHNGGTLVLPVGDPDNNRKLDLFLMTRDVPQAIGSVGGAEVDATGFNSRIDAFEIGSLLKPGELPGKFMPQDLTAQAGEKLPPLPSLPAAGNWDIRSTAAGMPEMAPGDIVLSDTAEQAYGQAQMMLMLGDLNDATLANELTRLDNKNIRSYYKALDETSRVCRNKAVQSFQNDMARARNSESFLRQSKNPAVRSQLPNAKAGRIDSTIRMRENLNSLIATDAKSNSLLTVKGEEVRLDNQRLKKWMGNIERGIPPKPAGPMVFGETSQYRLPGTEKVNSLVSKGIRGYRDFRTNAKVTAVAGKGMTVFGGAMIGAAWYGMAKADNASEGEALAAGALAGLATLNRFGVLTLGAKDLEHHLTVKAKKYGADQELSYALKGLDVETDETKELINRRILVRQGVYTAVKATSYSSVFYMNPALMVTGAALEAGLVVYEAYEEADLWQRYARQLEKANQAQDAQNIRRGGWVSGKIARQLELQAKALNNAVAGYHHLIQEKDKIAMIRQEFSRSDEAFQAYLKNLARQMEAVQAAPGQDQTQSGLANLERIQHQSDLHVARINQTAAALRQNPASVGSAQSVLSSMVGNYQSLAVQMDLLRPMVGQNASQGPENASQSPLASLKSYQKRLARLAAMLRPRYESAGYLMNNNKKIAGQIQAFKKRHAAYSASISRYEGYLMQQQGAEATTARAEVRAARAKIDAIKVPVNWQKGYVDQLTKHYFQIRELYRQVQDSAKFLGSVYPDPLGSYYDSLQPQPQDATGEMNRQWQANGQALKRFHNALGLLHAQVAAIVPEAQPELVQTREEAVEYRDWDPSELRRELARLQALKRELGKRSEAAIADLNKAYFADRDALWQAYENAFKTPKVMTCENCQTETLHSMDYSDNPPTVWCNSCGRILSFMEWSGSGESLSQIRTRGQAKKAAILEQLATNRRAVDVAISQVKAAM